MHAMMGAMLSIALAAFLCGSKACVDCADFAEANEQALAEIVDLERNDFRWNRSAQAAMVAAKVA